MRKYNKKYCSHSVCNRLLTFKAWSRPKICLEVQAFCHNFNFEMTTIKTIDKTKVYNSHTIERLIFSKRNVMYMHNFYNNKGTNKKCHNHFKNLNCVANSMQYAKLLTTLTKVI